jgi:phthalate 4,5-cis-dihydrodiol dehydrogenase
MERALRFGIAGAGNEGRNVAPYVHQAPGIELTAIADIRPEGLEAFKARYPQVSTFDSVEKMCASGEVDAIWIATPNPVHAEHTITAARHGVHIVLEKPMALTLDQAQQMVEAVETNGVQLLMNSHANDVPVKKIRETIDSGRLGRLIGVNSWSYKSWLRSPRLPFEVDTALGGGVVFRQGPHQIEIVRMIGGGRVKSVRAYTGRWMPAFDTEGNYTALLEFEDGTPATLVFNGYGYFNIMDLTWGISEGATQSPVEYRARPQPTGPADPATYYRAPRRPAREHESDEKKQPIFGLTIVSCERGDIRQSPDGLFLYTDDGLEEIPLPPHQDRLIELNEMQEALRTGRSAFPDGRWGMATLEVILAILQSSRERREVALAHQVGIPAMVAS